MPQCTVDKCGLDGKYDGKCALHCEKRDYQNDRRNGVLSDFYEELAQYIHDELSHSYKKSLQDSLDDARERHLQSSNFSFATLLLDDGDGILKKILSDEIMFFGAINFPEIKSRDTFDFFKLFQLFKGVHFDRSTIGFGSINLKNVQLFFQDCTFTNDWSIHSYLIIEDVVSQTIFQNCIFKERVASAVKEHSRDILKVDCYLFNDCKFNKKVIFNRGIYTKSIFNNSNHYKQILLAILIENCEFQARFELNNSDITLLTIENMEFEGKFELKKSNIKEIQISNVNFKKLFDAYKTKFNKFNISRSIFEDFTGFEKCEFGTEHDAKGEVTEFEYVTFLNFANFRKAKFYNGLDFEHTNLKEPLNFLNAHIDPKNTNRETYRIIKHSFEDIGNKIEANSYFSKEMKAYEVELVSHVKETKGALATKKLKHTLECKKFDEISVSKLKSLKTELAKYQNELLIYRLNRVFSNFGQNYVQSLVLMIMSTLLYLATSCAVMNDLFDWSSFVGVGFNDFAKAIPPYGRFLEHRTAFITLFYQIFFLICTWHFIVAIKMRSKR
jgi:uncharacterized protein YjbI with pentapeptide repeats